MGLNISVLNSLNSNKSIIDIQALERVSEKIFNPDNEKTVDLSKLNLSKFNRVSLGTDLYAARTSTETALQASKAKVDFDINLSKAFTANVQYLNSQAAQSLFTSKENGGKIVLSSEIANQKTDSEIVNTFSQINETKNMDNDRKGSNPFSFYFQTETNTEQSDNEPTNTGSINIFA